MADKYSYDRRLSVAAAGPKEDFTFEVSENDLTNAIFHGSAMNGEFVGSKAEARQIAKAMIDAAKKIPNLGWRR